MTIPERVRSATERDGADDGDERADGATDQTTETFGPDASVQEPMVAVPDDVGTPHGTVERSAPEDDGAAGPRPSDVTVHLEEVSAYSAAVPNGLHVAAAWGWRVIVVVILVAGIGYALSYLSEVTIPLLVATLLTALLLPVTKRLHKWGVNRGLATAITVLGGLAIIVGVLVLIVSSIVSQSAELSTNVVSGFDQLANWLQTGPLKLSASYLNPDQWVTRITAWLKDSTSEITTYAAEVGSSVGHFLAGLALVLFTLFYFLHNGREIFEFLLRFFPKRSRRKVDSAVLNGWKSLSSYVRATILVALADGVGVLIAAEILRVPAAPALAALVFIGAFVPIVGAFVSGFVAVLVALVALGPIKALIMLGAIVLVMEVESHVLQPFLMGRAVKLHPLAVLLAIAIGIILGGIVGALFAVPLLAFTKTFVQHLSDELPTPETSVVSR